MIIPGRNRNYNPVHDKNNEVLLNKKIPDVVKNVDVIGFNSEDNY